MKKKAKYLVLPLLLIAAIFSFGLNKVQAEDEQVTTTAAADEGKVKVYMFRGEGCGFCAKALAWFEEIEPTEGKYYDLITFEVWNDEDNKAEMNKVAKYFGDAADGVPYIIVGEKTWNGFDESYKDQILKQIHSEYEKNPESRFDVFDYLKNNNGGSIGTFIIVGVVFALIVFVIVSRNDGKRALPINNEKDEDYYEDEEDEEVPEEKPEEVKEEKIVHEKVSHKANTSKKQGNKSTPKKTNKTNNKKNK